jgi:hypothetical protein
MMFLRLKDKLVNGFFVNRKEVQFDDVVCIIDDLFDIAVKNSILEGQD